MRDNNQNIQAKRPVKRLVACILVVALCLCVVCGKVLLNSRDADWDRASEVATSLATTLEADIVRNIESYDLSLQGVIDNLQYTESSDINPELRQALLFDRSATAKHLDTIVLLDKNGTIRLDSTTPFPKPVSRADRDYFQFHKSNVDSGLHISKPFVARSTGNHVVAISRRVSNPDGSFAGVVVGLMRLSYFQELFRGAAIGRNGSITLSRTDGTLLMRWPFNEAMIGKNFRETWPELYRHVAISPIGRFETAAAVDGIYRLVVYRKIVGLPLVVGVGQASAEIYAQWQSDAFAVGILMLLLCATSVALGLYLAREMNRRNAAEAMLALQATTDSLTGLFNRRCFNQASAREWRRAMRERTPLALVMLDVDFFKEYNDQHGHQAGDKLLQALGTAMNQIAGRRGTDVASRYGGDEFAILLPATSTDGALEVAKQVRSRFGEVCDEQDVAHSQLSIGVASVVPGPGEDQSFLVAAADQALYRAKELGRNRTEVAPASVCKPVLVTSRDKHAAA